LTAQDRARIQSDARKIADNKELPLVGPPVVPVGPGAPEGLVSPEGDVAYTAIRLPNDFEKAADWGKTVREDVGEQRDGLNTYVAGDLGFNTDAEEIFADLDAKLLIATVLLVLVLLGAIYRAVLVAITPLIVVFFAYNVSTGFIYLLSQTGSDISTSATSILIVLMFGVGTDYCLLLVSRYREELHRHEDKHDAIRIALERTAPAIIASGLTVALSMLVLLVAITGQIEALGPVSAIGITFAFIAGVTLLPAMLAIFGRVGFWPRRNAVAYDPAHAETIKHGLWGRFGARVLEKPALALGATLLLFGAGALGILAYKETFSSTGFFKKPVESVDGFKVLERSLPAGALSPTTVLVHRDDGGRVTRADLAPVEEGLRTVPEVAAVEESPQRSRDGTIGNLNVTLKVDPNSDKALQSVPKMRDATNDVPGVEVLVGGGSAIYYDYDKATNRDTKWIVPLGLLVVTLMLALLLRAILAPLVLIGTVIASFFGTFGMAILFIRYVVGDPGVDSTLPAFAFIFLTALGVDYTIFLMSRVREEAATFGTREGTLRALNATGPVITSAGIILAGTFSVLMTLPVTFTFNLGLVVAAGILLDTFIVRTIMVPAAVELIGDKIWWPSNAKAGGGALRERASDSHAQLAPEPVPAHE
jgi:RND superfamily putative drug exporter